jgi:primosomal protein N' (replication factor Y) (superfamily II helicase)
MKIGYRVAIMPRRTAAQPINLTVRILVPLALPAVLDYAWEGDTQPTVGAWVVVNVGRQTVHGVVVAVGGDGVFQGALKPAAPMADVPPVAPPVLAFWRWLARYTLSAPGEALRVALPKGRVPSVPKLGPKLGPKRAGKQDERRDGARTMAPVVLNAAQAEAVQAVQAADGFRVFLLDGVTGSGKTEVYFAAMDGLLARGAQTLVLVPEIALTPQWVARFTQHFGQPPLVWHSGLTPVQRARTWWAVATGQAGVVVGARSALFLPWQNLRLVVVDEEHDPSYKQEQGFIYHGRDAAVALAKHVDCPVLLASATPSLESWQHARQGKYDRLVLPARVGGRMAAVQLVDLRAHKLPSGTFLAPPVVGALQDTLARGEQALVFLNRRGNAPLLVCSDCGHRVDCPRCDATLVVHGRRLQCHHCGYQQVYPDACPQCAGISLKAYGPGTRRVVQEVQAALPTARVAVADSDALTTAGQLGALVDEMLARQVDVLVGTQMITKGHHFPHLTTVVVVDADVGLAHGALRATERTFQLLTQVAGRAGREALPGKAWVQTHNPTQPLLEALVAHDRQAFYDLELAARRAWHHPPFGRQLAVQLSGADERDVVATAQALAKAFALVGPQAGLNLLGPAPAPIARVNDRHRWRLLVQGERLPHAVVQRWIEGVPLGKGVRLQVDIDPL